MTPEFKKAVQAYGPRFMTDLGLTRLHVGGIFGNLAVESGQFTQLQEVNPTVKGSRGGWGWPQWTGPRRRQFEAWAKANGLKLDDPEGFYRYMVLELQGSEKAALAKLKRTKTLDTATTAFMLGYERPGIPHEDKRKKYALEALQVLDEEMGGATTPVKAPKIRKWAEELLPDFEIVAIQKRLIELGYHTVGLPNGVWGTSTTAAIKKMQETAKLHDPDIIADGHYGPQTKALLADPNSRVEISETRKDITAKDLAKVGNPGVVSGRRIQWSAVAGFASTAFSVLVLAFQNYQQGTDTLPWAVQAVLNFLPPWAAMLAPAAFALYNAMVAKGLVGASVERVREGIDNNGLPPLSQPAGNLPWPFNLIKR